MHASRLQYLVIFLAGIFLLGTVFVVAVLAVAPETALVYRPFLLTAFVATLFISMVCTAWLLRGLLRPYSQLVGEAKRAPVAHSGKSQNEAAFVLETFQSVIAQLQEQQTELQRLTEQASQRADSAERFNDRIVASMPTGLIAFDATGQVTVMNGPAHALFSHAKTEGEHFATVFSNAPALAEMVDACLSTGRVFRREEIETTNGANSSARLGATVAPIDPESASGARGALCLITDITEVTQLREQVALKRNLESLGEMSAGLAHEFKNAMAALHGYAQFLQTIDADEQGKTATDALLQEVRNLSEMTTAFLNFARPQALQLEEVSLDELIQECARELKPMFETRRVELAIKGVSSAQPQRPLRLGGESAATIAHRRDAESPEETQRIEVRADLRMLRQALSNLLRNAAEAIPDDQVDRTVIIEIAAEHDHEKHWVLISSRDTGPGIPASDLQKIFIPFFTTKSHGHGIGLALAHRVITQHGGTLTASNASEGGAVFTIRLLGDPS
jgi:signal transduction histidine kinase